MEKFYGGGGNQNPTFIYQFRVKKFTNEMYLWCEAYPGKGPFTRWHVEHSFRRQDGCEILHMEYRDAYLAFMYAFAGEILEDKSIGSFKVGYQSQNQV
jgi:hypothetical protein